MDRLRNSLMILAMLAVPAGAHTFLAAPATLCFTNGLASYRISTRVTAPDYRVKIENKAARPDLRIAIVDTPDTADFVLVDDFAGIESSACAESTAKTIKVGPSERAPDMTISLERDAANPDYRLYVYSARFSNDQAAALLAVMSKRVATAKLAQR
jgi:hypothetical protein